MKLANTFWPSLGKKRIHLGSTSSRLHTWSMYMNPSYFSQILKADLDDIKFPRASNLLRYVDDLVLFSLFQASSQENIIYLLAKAFILKGT